MLETKQYARKPFYVDAIQVTSSNMEAIANWCGGTVLADAPDIETKHVRVVIERPTKDSKDRAYVGDWVVRVGKSFRVYTVKSFERCFEVTKEKTAPRVLKDERCS